MQTYKNQMNKNDFKDPKKTDVLFEYKKDLNFLINLYNDKKFPRIIMISGKKGLGKFTLVNHFFKLVFKEPYDLINNHLILILLYKRI